MPAMRGHSYFKTKDTKHCCGCEACAQACPVGAIEMVADEEGFRYPRIDVEACVSCGMCDRICSADACLRRSEPLACFGGHILDAAVLGDSTSGGIFSAIAESFLEQGGVVFGVEPDGAFGARHACTSNVQELNRFRGSKYIQSRVGAAYSQALERLKLGERVLFSGTPCQIAGLKARLGRWAQSDCLLTVEVVCEGVPSPLFAEKQCQFVSQDRFSGDSIALLRYRDKALDRWDYQVTSFVSSSGKTWKTDRWFNPFWSIWLKHLMSRPSCYGCVYAGRERCADISLGDLWGVHLYCPDLYNGNRGASIAFCNSERGTKALEAVMSQLDGRWLDVDDAIRYQKPMREPIEASKERALFMADLRVLDYQALCEKWADEPSRELLVSKYLWGTNAQVCERAMKLAAASEADDDKNGGAYA